MSHDISTLFRQRDVISIQDFSTDEIIAVLDLAKKLHEKPQTDLLRGKLMASCFFEPSTRTRLSFESAMKRLGGDVIGFAESQSTSISKKETLYDTIRMLECYADIIVMRHPLDGAAAHAAASTTKPVINAGDGSNQHPTQTLLDLFTIRESQGKLNDLHIAFSGDLKYSRTSRSLIQAASYFNMRLYFIAVPGLEVPKELCDSLKQRGVLFSFHQQLKDVMPKLDIVYMTRIQEERLSANQKGCSFQEFVLTKEQLSRAKPSLRVLHALPRVNEIAREVDDTPHALYFEQARYGVSVRQALLTMILGAL